MSDDITHDIPPQDDGDLLPVAHMLRANRPVPAATFRGDLRRALASRAHVSRPARLWLRIAAPAGSGLGLLGVAAAGVLGTGPFAA